MKNKIRRLIALAAALLLVCLCCAAMGEVATIGVSFSGMTEQEDGSYAVTSLSGSFRLIRNGETIAVLRAGEDTVTVSGTDRLFLEPVMETMPLGWDLSTAGMEITPPAGTTMFVPVVVYASKEAPKPAVIPTEAPTSEPAVRTAEILAVATATPLPESAPAVQAAYGEPIVLSFPTAVPAAAPTPEPALPERNGGSDSAALHVLAFDDRNTNGEQGVYETGIPDVLMYLLQADTGEAVASARTNSQGEALISNIPAGTYRLKAFLPESWAFSELGDETGLKFSCIGTSVNESAESVEISLKAGETAERGIGAARMIHVSGFCWFDEDGNGIYKKGENHLAGIRITLEGQKNGLFYETASDGDGNWYVDRVKPGFYTITAYAPEGMTFTRYSKTGGNNRSIFTAEGAVKASKTLDTNDKMPRDNQNIGFTVASEITGMCFLDANYNGLYDEGEKPLKGVKVTAIRQLQDDEIAVAYSDETGHYKLAGLRGNTYRVRAVLPDDGADFTMVTADPQGNHFLARPGRRENFWTNFNLGDGERKYVNVGAIYPASVSGTVYYDDDLSSSLTGKERTVSGFLVSVLNSAGETVAYDKTDIKGRYFINGLVPGTYTLKATAVKGYAFTRIGEGNVMLNRTEGEGYTESFALEIGDVKENMSMGMILPGRVDGTLFADLNDNGIQDAEEKGLRGAAVQLMGEEGEAFRAEIEENSEYYFDAVMPGRYRLVFTLPENAVFAKTVQGGNTIREEEGSTVSGASEWFTVAAGAEVTAPVCGALTLGRISGRAFADPDGSGKQSTGENGAEGVTLILTPTRDDLQEMTAVTGPDGSFLLDQLHPDTYTLTVTMPEGTVLSRTDALALALEPGKADQKITLPVPMGTVRESQELGVVKPAALSGRFWLDENNDGIQDADEQTPAGYTIQITDELTGAVYANMLTDNTGHFETGDLIPSSYTVSFKPDENTLPAKAGDSTFTEENGRLVMKEIRLAEDEKRDDLVLGVVQYTSLGGNVWIDRGNAIEMLPGAVVTLKTADGQMLGSMATGETGGYRFDGLMPGDYTIETDLPGGCVVAEPGDARLTGSRISVAVSTSGRHGASDTIHLKMGQHQMNLDFGAVLPGRLGDYCWLDLNSDGLQDYNEPGLANVKIELIRDGATVMETTSDVYGYYRFEEIYPAAYTLRVTPPAEVKATKHREDIPMIASVLPESDEASVTSGNITVESNKANYNADLGFACRVNGVRPAGAGEAPTQDWTSWAGSEN
ncbi:MAG: hypothetical protein IJJ42_04065 [Clostridia bacterium]|nr:hypothetical protein [Clostridia bacterium]